MRKAFVLGGLVVLSLGLSGCGGSADSLMKEQIQCMNDMAEALEKDEPETKLTEIKNRMEEISKKLDKLKLSDEEKKKIAEAHKEEITRAAARLQKALVTKMGKRMGEGFPGMPGLGNPP